MPHDPALTFSLALATGMIAQSLAHTLRVPGIVLLLLAGVLLGPDVLGVLRPESLGHALEILVGLSVAVILFEGGLSLNYGRLRREATSIRRLITVGAAITALLGTLAARLFMGWSWSVAILFGTLVVVTGPTVITPLLRRIRVTRTVGTVLEAEGVLIDPIGAITAVVALEVILAQGSGTAATGLLGIPARLLVGAAVGAVGGFLIGYVISRDEWVPEGLENVFTLSLVLVLFALSNAVLPESGIMTVVVAGMVVGNMETGLGQELREFKESLTVMLVGLLFVLLAADVRLAEVVALGWGGVATVAVLMLLVRPLGVAVSTLGSSLSLKERAFMAWLGPRGIVAAAVASLFAQALREEGFPEAEELRALVFLVIAATVVIQGLTGGWVASLLGVRRLRSGYLIVGANALARTLARVLETGGESVVLIDTNARNVRAAEEEGLRVLFGSANDENRLMRADVEARRGFLGLTSNEGINLLLARKARETFKIPMGAVALHQAKAGVGATQVREAGATVLFGRATDLDQWSQRLQQGSAEVTRWRFAGEGEGSLLPAGEGELERSVSSALLPLAVLRDGSVRPVDEQTRVRPGDVVAFALDRPLGKQARERLRAAGWEDLGAVERPDAVPGG